MMDFKEELKKVPEQPGVYLMHAGDGTIIYVGKAIKLRNRMRSYFDSTPHNERITNMIARIDYFEYIVTDSEYEALLLECNLIKKHRPKYNVLLKDDKNYPYIKVTLNEEFPRVMQAHKAIKDGGKYFGPYYSGIAVRTTLETFATVFPMRSCKKAINPEKPQRVCLNYHIGRCPGPCAGYITREDYAKNVDAVCDFLSGKSAEIIGKLTEEMMDAADNMDFERAAKLRDRVKALGVMSEKQKIMLGNSNSLDVIAIFQNETDAVVQAFFVRGGVIGGRDYYVFEGAGNTPEGEIIQLFIEQFYDNESIIPSKIYVSHEVDNPELLEKMLAELAGHNVEIIIPQRGEKRELMEMAKNNAVIALTNYETTKRNENGGNLRRMERLRDVLGLENLPMRIESYDISNLGDSEIDGSMVVFTCGKPDKKEYKHYKIKSLEKRSDVASMNEMLTRRFTRLANNDDGFSKAPDLILMDGGVQQVNEALRVLGNLEIKIPVFGMVKNNKHQSRGLISAEGREFILEDDPEVWRFVTDIQNETHRFAITYNRKLTEKRYKKSPLDDIKGVGNARKMALLRKFESVKGIKAATVQEIAEVSKIGEKLAQEIKEALK